MLYVSKLKLFYFLFNIILMLYKQINYVYFYIFIKYLILTFTKTIIYLFNKCIRSLVYCILRIKC